MTNLPSVSVIVPVYNRAELICRTVQSLLDQEFHQAFEVVIVDDGSSDGTADIVDGLDRRIRVIKQANRGASAARQAGVQAARADIVAFLDSDDISLPGHLTNLWNGLHRRADVVASHAMLGGLQDPSHFFSKSAPLQLDKERIHSDPLVNLLRIGCIIASMNLMTYRNLAIRCMAGRERFLASNDYDFSLRLATCGSFAFVDEYTIHAERRSDGISHTKGALQAAFAVLAARDAVKLSGRQDQAALDALRHRIELVWPSAAVQLAAEGRMMLALEVVAAGLRWGRLSLGARHLWWSMDYHRKTRRAKYHGNTAR